MENTRVIIRDTSETNIQIYEATFLKFMASVDPLHPASKAIILLDNGDIKEVPIFYIKANSITLGGE